MTYRFDRSTGGKPAARNSDSATKSSTSARAKRPTLVDIAKASDVSKATVSLVLRNNPSIPERTRERVLEAAKKLGYVYNRGAANLRAAGTKLIAMAVNDLTNPYFAEIVASMEDALTEQNRVVLISNTAESVARQEAFAAVVREYNVDGMLIVPAVGTDNSFVTTLRSWHMPFVCVSRSIPGADVDLVQANHRSGMMSAMNHLLGLGHRRIAIVSTNERISTGRQRYAGYRTALSQAGIPLEPRLVRAGAPTRDAGMAHMLALLDMPEPPTAVVCFNDIVAFGVMLGLKVRGLTAGKDVSVIGFDDIAEATLWRPALTTVAVARQEVARASVDLLLKRIEAPETPAQTVLLPATLVVRDTTAPPAS